MFTQRPAHILLRAVEHSLQDAGVGITDRFVLLRLQAELTQPLNVLKGGEHVVKVSLHAAALNERRLFELAALTQLIAHAQHTASCLHEHLAARQGEALALSAVRSRNDVQHFAILTQGAAEPGCCRAERWYAGDKLRLTAACGHALMHIPRGRIDRRVTEREERDSLSLPDERTDGVRRRIMARVPRRPVVRHGHGE